MTEEIIMDTLSTMFTSSRRDNEALKLLKDNLRIEKIGRWYYLTLFGKSTGIYCSSKYCYRQINFLLSNNKVWELAKKNVKESYKKQSRKDIEK